MKEYLIALRSTQEFQNMLEWMKKERPQIPLYEHAPDNTESWKAMSNQQRGFDLCMTLLGETKYE